MATMSADRKVPTLLCSFPLITSTFYLFYTGKASKEKKGFRQSTCASVCPLENVRHLEIFQWSCKYLYKHPEARSCRVCVCVCVTLVCIVYVSAPGAPCSVITWGNLLPNQYWHTQSSKAVLLLPHSRPPHTHTHTPLLLLARGGGGSQLILHHFIFLSYKDGEWLAVSSDVQFMLFCTVREKKLFMACITWKTGLWPRSSALRHSAHKKKKKVSLTVWNYF